MPSALEIINQFAKGIIKVNAPSMARGALSEAYKNLSISVDDAIEAVERNRRLWPLIPEHYHAGIVRLVDMVGGLDWLTADWLIEASRKDAPQLASLFLGWRKARNWLGRQIEDCKREIENLKPT